MAINYEALFASNFFTRQQVDILVRLSEHIIANSGGGGGGVSDNTKADKSTLLIASTGLTGGGDLSGNRSFALDLSFLDARYPLMVDGKISPSVMPSISTTDRFVVASESAMTSLSDANKGDLAIRTDVSKTFILADEPYSVLANWSELLTPGSAVASFNGRTGTIVPTTGDYTFAQIGSKPTTLAGYGITDAEPAIAAGTATQYRRGDKTWQELNKAAVGLANVDNTSDNAKPLGTAQLATLAAETGMGLIGGKGPGTGAIVRTLDAQLYERGLSLRNYALADGSDDTARVVNWLNALKNSNRMGYIPAGDYIVGAIDFSADFIDVVCHPQARFIGSVASNPMISFTSLSGTSTTRVGRVRWVGGQFDVSARNYTTTGTGTGVKCENYASVEWTSAQFLGGADHEAAVLAGKAGSGLRLIACDRPNIHANIFRGFAEEGLCVSGGTNAASSGDDAAGGTVTGNHFVKCSIGVNAKRSHRNVSISNNDIDQCLIGVAAYESETAAKPARVSVTSNRFRRPGSNAIHLRMQRGFVVGDNVITDPGYKLDGSTPITAGTVKSINLEGCERGEVHDNVISMDELAESSSTYGITNLSYTFDSVTYKPTEVHVHHNHVRGLEIGCSEAGASGVENSYRDNTFINVVTEYDNVPAEFMPQGSWSPTLTNVTNVASSSANPSLWNRIGRDVTCNVHFSIDPTAAGFAEVEFDLPVDPGQNFGNDYDLIGVATSGTTATGGALGHFLAKTADRKARLRMSFDADDLTNHTWAGTFSYRVGAQSAPPPPGGLQPLHFENGTTIIHMEDGVTPIEV